MSRQREALRELLESFAAALGRRLATPPSAVVVFGPVAAAVEKDEEPLPRPPQLDLLVLAEDLPPSRWDRHDLVYEALLEIEPQRDALAEETGWWPYLGIVLKTPGELAAAGGLPAALRAGVWTVNDPDGTFAGWRREAENGAGGSPRRAGRGDRIYWRFEEPPETQVELARGLLRQAEARLLAARQALEEDNHPFVVRAAHEAVELSLKAILARVGVDPPAWHDVGRELREQADALAGLDPAVVDELAAISSKLREHRDASVYGDRLDRLPPERLFSEYDGRVSRDWARQAFEIALDFVHDRRARR